MTNARPKVGLRHITATVSDIKESSTHAGDGGRHQGPNSGVKTKVQADLHPVYDAIFCSGPAPRPIARRAAVRPPPKDTEVPATNGKDE